MTDTFQHHQGAQAFLVGETIYLRPIEKEDAKHSVALRDSVYPYSPERAEAWIKDEIAQENPWDGTLRLAIRRKDDERIVGAATIAQGREFMRFEISSHIAPGYGARGLRWKAEAIALAVDFMMNERQAPMLRVRLPATEQVVIDSLVQSGMRISVRLRERYMQSGKAVDEVILQAFNDAWVETLGDPGGQVLERTGEGTPRPRPRIVAPVPVAPPNALVVGPRVYLRPCTEADIERYVREDRFEMLEPFLPGRNLSMLPEELHYHNEDEKADIPGFIPLAVCLRETHAYIGEVALVNPDWINRTAETASWMLKEYRAQGYGSEAKHLLLDYAFNRLGLRMLESWVRYENTRSAAALRKQGYREAGTFCWTSYRSGQFTNFIVFDLLAREWQALARDQMHQ